MFQLAYCFIGAATSALRRGGVNGRVEIGLARPDLRELCATRACRALARCAFPARLARSGGFLPFLGKQKREKQLSIIISKPHLFKGVSPPPISQTVISSSNEVKQSQQIQYMK